VLLGLILPATVVHRPTIPNSDCRGLLSGDPRSHAAAKPRTWIAWASEHSTRGARSPSITRCRRHRHATWRGNRCWPLSCPESHYGKHPIKARVDFEGVILFLFPVSKRAATKAEPCGVCVTIYRDDDAQKLRDYGSNAWIPLAQLLKDIQPEWGTVIISPNSQ
jgi:hypothetical protein